MANFVVKFKTHIFFETGKNTYHGSTFCLGKHVILDRARLEAV